MTTPTPSSKARTREFRIECIVRGISAAGIAAELGVTRQAVSRLIRGEIRAKRIEDELLRRFPHIFEKFPFGVDHDKTVARVRFRENCAPAQEGRSHTSRKSRKPARRQAKRSRRSA